MGYITYYLRRNPGVIAVKNVKISKKKMLNVGKSV